MCQASGLRNPFRGFAGIQTLASDLYTKMDIFVTDGGLKINVPMWSFLTPARQGTQKPPQNTRVPPNINRRPNLPPSSPPPHT